LANNYLGTHCLSEALTPDKGAGKIAFDCHGSDTEQSWTWTSALTEIKFRDMVELKIKITNSKFWEMRFYSPS
jgi:hypothetical protein